MDMTQRLVQLKVTILESPGFRTLFGAVIPTLSGVLSGTFVFEITTPAGLDWQACHKAWSLYGLVVLCYLSYWYYRELLKFEREVQRFLDDDYCIAYMRSRCLPEAAARYQELIRAGNGGELKQAMDEIKKVLR